MINPEKVLIAWLIDQFPGVHVGVSTPPGTSAAWNGQIIRCYRTSGANRWHLDAPIVDVDCFDVDDSHASDFALGVCEAFTLTLPHSTFAGAAFTRVNVIDSPRRLPWDNTNVSRYGASYQINLAPVAA